MAKLKLCFHVVQSREDLREGLPPLKVFFVEEGARTDSRFWKLAQSLSALYPQGTEEKRRVDGVLARKKGLGF